MKNNFIVGFFYVGKGFRLIFKPGVRRFVIIPLLINLIIFSGAIYWGHDLLNDWLGHSLPGWLNWLRWLVIPVFLVTALIIIFYTFTLLANLIAAPFNSVLSEKIETHLNGNMINSSGNLLSIAKEIPTAIFSELKKLTYLGLWIVPLLILFIIPGINIIAPIAWGLFSMWMLALEYTDYPMGNNGFSFSQEKRLLKQYKWLAWGFGGGILLITFIPVLNFFAMPVGVAGATALWVEKLRDQSGRL